METRKQWGHRTPDRTFEELVKSLTRAFRAKVSALGPSAPLNLLMLSGGSSRGAWGAGLLNGWSSAATGPARPDFDVVTGVSTGAVMATHAFLGKAKDLEMKLGYTTTTNGDVYGFPYVFIPRNFNALRETLKNRYVTNDVIDEVKAVAESATPRKVYVGTVSLESAQFCAWDLTELAVQSEYDLYREAILASCANPQGVWPIEIDGEQHVDGGVRLRLFAEGVMNAVGVAAGEGGAELTGTKTAYYIVNGKLHKTPKPIPSWNWAAILERTLDIVMKEATFGSLYAAWYRLNSDCGDWKFQGSWIPQGQDLPDSGEYDPVDMTALYDAGEVAGLANVWHDGLPDPDYGCLMP